MTAKPLTTQEIQDRLRELPGWSQEGDRIARTYRLGSHVAAAALVAHVVALQEELNHHSELTLGYDTVGLTVTSHDVGGAVTGRDFALAARVEAAASAHGAE
ncbi:4a-hydroxytetrahydrobiopterin dehydratase [Streptomyces sp. LP05-1]|uniref:Putative pterin-4-alpha-carbinolamine dehydratase n=1 Tax=Streptomyces pyxinae TaxID=2970734 RepID=A0ABT2CMA8_9ACTN|nr:4a-hydroxytetrahydrobiopterin dehydratase [Streptomyces sp. LP05-1]MCS0638568.1 4a-hydroxytetrahydrobiopterin dehydratase [Streptomyces sp. LP05-1]